MRTMTPIWSDEVCRIHDRPPGHTPTLEEAIGYYTAESRPIIEATIEAAINEGTPFDVELSIRTAAGRRIFVRSMGEPEFEDGRCVRLSGVFQDVTTRREAENRLRLTQFTIERSPDSVFWVDRGGHVMFVNETACNVLGYTQEELLKLRVMDINPTVDAVSWGDLVAAIKNQRSIVLESRHRAKDGTIIPVEVSCNHVLYDGQEFFCAFARDISDRLAAAQELHRYNAELEKSNRELEQFVYTASHDLKAPLVTIAGYAGYLADDLRDDRYDDLPDYVDRIERNAQRMRDTIDDLLDLSRIDREASEAVDVDLCELANEACETNRALLDERQVTVKIDFEVESWRADVVRLRQVMANLVTNAIRHGCLSPSNAIEIGSVAGSDNELRIYVRDFGPGIDPEHHERIFRLFHRLTNEPGSTGVGLAIVRRVAECHGGTAWVDSAPGEGATFWVSLQQPCSSLEATEQHDAAGHANEANSLSPR
ncbi:MAG: ATP-binding protein [Planctomycetota bacterium]